MNIENLLKYQKLDEELFKVEQKILNSPYKKKANELATIAKKSQAKSAELEAEAEKLIAEIADLKDKYNINKSKSDEMLATKVEDMSFEDIEKNDFNLNIPRYVDNFEKEEEIDLKDILDGMADIDSELEKTQNEFVSLLKELTSSDETIMSDLEKLIGQMEGE